MATVTLQAARETLLRVFGYPRFRPGQSAAVFSVLRGRDTVVILPTGGGKSLCYQVPAVLFPGLTVVVSPLISLMRDQVGALRAKGVPAAFINSSLSSSEGLEQLARAERGELKLLYIAPERFELGDVIARLVRARVSLLAIDEAHCISHWGHDFRPSYRRLLEVRRKLGWPTAIAVTATATPEVRADIAAQLRLRNPTVIVTGFDRPNLAYSVVGARTDDVKAPLIRRAISQADGASIVYASTKRTVDRISASLRASGFQVGAYHAGLDSLRRKQVQDAFMAGELRTIVATNAFGMGIDKPDVRLVAHYSMPGTLEAYYQEAGRAGRDGRDSKVVLLHSFADRFTHEFFIASAHPSRAIIEFTYAALQRAAGASGIFSGEVSALCSAGRNKGSLRSTESAIRILESAGAVSLVPADSSVVSVRLIAVPARINAEIGSEDSMQLGLLRALWSAAGNALERGTEIDLNGLPPGLNGPGICLPLLEDLQNRQFLHWTRTGAGIRLTDRRAPLSAFSIDWSAPESRRRGEIRKLEMMQNYAHTRGCRRAFLMRYFGDAPRSLRCDSCDNCRK
jgi:ATP-dependent DNA helicase RecQ